MPITARSSASVAKNADNAASSRSRTICWATNASNGVLS
jgi:hypothetical protein